MKLRTVIPNQAFKHGAETYEEGQSYEVSLADAEYFESAGWIGERHAANVTIALDIHDMTLGHEARIN